MGAAGIPYGCLYHISDKRGFPVMSITVVGKSAEAGKAAICPYPGGTELDGQLFSWGPHIREGVGNH